MVGGETGMRNMRVGCQHRPRVSRQQLRRHAVGAVDRTVDDWLDGAKRLPDSFLASGRLELEHVGLLLSQRMGDPLVAQM